MRLGELLIADGRLSEEQVEQGLRAQVLWGGRLGTNLVELGLLDLDELSWTLARLHRVPVALSRHFAQPDAALQSRLGAQLAERWQCVPLARLAEDPPRIGLAATTPLSDAAVAQIAHALGEEPEAIVVAIAAEMRILYHLEVSYGIERPARYMRARDEELPEPPPPVYGEGSETELEIPILHVTEPEPAAIGEPPSMTLAQSGDEVSTGPELRRYMPLVGDDEREERRVGRIAIRRVQVYTAEGEAPEGEAPASWPEALRAIRRAQDRDRVGELAVASLTTFCSPLRVAALLVVRGHVAIGWLGRHRGGPLDVGAIALPLDQPSAISEAVASGEGVTRLVHYASELDRRLVAALAGTDLAEMEAGTMARIMISPISLSEGRVACVLYCQLDPDEGEAAAVLRGDEAPVAELVENVVASMRSAFLRLIRAASR
jgi:Type II secretion system (T2SS), protein E, N-terminal domain